MESIRNEFRILFLHFRAPSEENIDERKGEVRRAETERDGTRAETRFCFPAKRTSPFISVGVSDQSAAGSRGVRISGSNAG